MIDLKKEVIGFESELIALRRDFHENPELGFKEFRTSKIIYDYLKKLNMEVKNISRTGVVGILNGKRGAGKTILLRASMDALPMQEKTGLSFSSVSAGVMHASGHDGDMAVLLVIAKVLARHRDEFKGNIKFVFQPNEEEAGMLSMIDDGILENPMVDAAFALRHWGAIESGRLGLTAGAVLGTTEEFEITVYGKSGNTSAPNTGKDAIMCAAKIIDALQFLETREYNPMHPMVIMIGQISGGTARTIISDEVKMGGTIRFLFPDEKENKEKVMSAFKRVIRGICDTYSMEYKVEFIPSNPSLINDKNLVYLMKSAAISTFGTEYNIDNFTGLMGEDFAEVSHRVPSVMTFLGVHNKEKGNIYPQGHPQFSIDEEIMKFSAELHIRAAIKYLNE
ncbi:M20 metallopeptidase family protein [Anaerotignum propionicum]|uniref:M20 metallopeptidase family protein n=1 Tax=Anaerotignum propionicum TaxID=28446 RepID=UPI00210F00B6|nr:amidohydrolase [Anaerotignum propionicum]MCQ4936318.1 amidohydrolase [Anaerotignum propionicum]